MHAQGDVRGWTLDAVAPAVVVAAVAFRQANPLPNSHVSTPRPARKRARSCDMTQPPTKRPHKKPPVAHPGEGPPGGAAEAAEPAPVVDPSGPGFSVPSPSSGQPPSEAAAPGSPDPAQQQQQQQASASVASTGHAPPADTAQSPAPTRVGVTTAKAAVAGHLHDPFPEVR